MKLETTVAGFGFALVLALVFGCSNAKEVNSSAPPSRPASESPENASEGDFDSSPAAETTTAPIDRTRVCGRFGDLSAERLGERRFSVKRAELVRSVVRFVEEAKVREKWFQPPPAKTRKGEEGYVMLRVGANVTCGLLAKDFLVRVNGKRLSDAEDRNAIYDSLSTAKELEVELERAGETISLVYVLRD